MQVKVSVRHGHVGEDIQSQMREKGEKLLHFFNRLTMIEVTVDLHTGHDGKRTVEIQATAEHDREFVASDTDEDVMVAFNRASAHVKQQIAHHKEKIQDHRRDPARGEGA